VGRWPEAGERPRATWLGPLPRRRLEGKRAQAEARRADLAALEQTLVLGRRAERSFRA